MATTAITVGQSKRSAKSWMRTHRPETIGTPLAIIAIILLWGAAVAVFDIRAVVLPSPAAVWQALILALDPANPANLYEDIGVTLFEILVGYILGTLLGLVLALILVQFRTVERITKPIIDAFQSMPKVAIAPLFIIWFGFGAMSKIALVVVVVFFPVLVAGLAGFKSVDQERLEVMQSLGASKGRTFLKLVFPASLPFVFTGLEISLVLAITTTIVAEFLSGTAGLGVVIVQMGQVLNTAGIFAVTIILGVIGWVLVAILAFVRRRVLFWSIDTRRPGI
ncbi:ABC transporter permease [Microbacterium allomyrinae]|uniref:ABC transporter permease n=1 Tax=Microbacterium allomyrinae TaxID=2830666 RepID=A0A9X1LSX6_9MICO|nr:ABC transporter permease [Microbacterium allomyrinae]MCC2031246.1 ABC transporter permease [Microbacterium allomyrinae]